MAWCKRMIQKHFVSNGMDSWSTPDKGQKSEPERKGQKKQTKAKENKVGCENIRSETVKNETANTEQLEKKKIKSKCYLNWKNVHFYLFYLYILNFSLNTFCLFELRNKILMQFIILFFQINDTFDPDLAPLCFYAAFLFESQIT